MWYVWNLCVQLLGVILGEKGCAALLSQPLSCYRRSGHCGCTTVYYANKDHTIGFEGEIEGAWGTDILMKQSPFT